MFLTFVQLLKLIGTRNCSLRLVNLVTEVVLLHISVHVVHVYIKHCPQLLVIV